MPGLQDLEKFLVCPHCRSAVRLIDRKFWCTGTDCRRSYPITDQDIPQMRPEDGVVEDKPAPEREI